MKTFSERNPLPIAIIGVLTSAIIFVLIFNAAKVPFIGGGNVYAANFAEASGLKVGNEVRVAGVRVGEVTDVTLDGTQVRVSFRVKDAWIGDQSTADIKIKTLLGQKYLAVDPLGDEALDPDDAIPLARTTTPLDVTDAFSDLSSTVDQVDTQQLAQSFRVISDTFADTPASVRGTIDGLSRLSQTISSRDDELAELLANTSELSGTLADRRDEIGLLINDGNSLLEELSARRQAIRQMLIGTRELSEQLDGLVDDNQQQLQPALDDLDRVTEILKRNQDNLRESLELLAPYYRLVTSTLGNGPWVDAYVCGLFTEQGAPVLDNDVVRDCRPGKSDQ